MFSPRAFSIILYMKLDVAPSGTGRVKCFYLLFTQAVECEGSAQQPGPIFPSYFIQQYNFCSSEYKQYKIDMTKIYILNRREKH